MGTLFTALPCAPPAYVCHGVIMHLLGTRMKVFFCDFFLFPLKKRQFFSSWKKQFHFTSLSFVIKHVREKKRRSLLCRDTKNVITSRVTTKETQKRRTMDERDSLLWGLIVKCDDICFQHILPRLNATDLKFLYGVNRETRKLIKRSSRASDLKEKFKIEEMSSISTLEFAWEHFPWGKEVRYGYGYMDEQYFCMKVAKTNKLELLKWAREEKECEWEQDTIYAAAFHGNLEMVKYCVANKCHIDWQTCANAAIGGHLEVLKYLHEEVKAPWDSWTATFAARKGHLHLSLIHI